METESGFVWHQVRQSPGLEAAGTNRSAVDGTAMPEVPFRNYADDVKEIPAEKLKPFVLSAQYQTASKNQPAYFCIALIQTFLGATPQVIGHAYLKASWQTESNPKECRKHLESALTNLSTALASLKSDSPDSQTISILCCELERRTERFPEARKRCENLLKTEAFKTGFLREVLQREMEFISKKDSAPHAITADQEKLLKDGK